MPATYSKLFVADPGPAYYFTAQRTDSADFWNGESSTFEAFTAENWQSYVIPCQDVGQGLYKAEIPDGLLNVGLIVFRLYTKNGATPATTDRRRSAVIESVPNRDLSQADMVTDIHARAGSVNG